MRLRFRNHIDVAVSVSASEEARHESRVPTSFREDAVASSSPSGRRLRDDYPFLSRADCPAELKILVSDRITLYHTYSSLYPQLRTCDSVEACADVAGRLLEAYLDNRQITAELDYYRDHGTVLGRHPVFAAQRRLRELASMSVVDLFGRKDKVERNIWRVKSEMRRADKPHLDSQRRERLKAYETELAQIRQLLGIAK